MTTQIRVDAQPGDLVITDDGHVGEVIGVYIRHINSEFPIDYEVSVPVTTGPPFVTETVHKIFTLPYEYRDHRKELARVAAEKVCERFESLYAIREAEREAKRKPPTKKETGDE